MSDIFPAACPLEVVGKAVVLYTVLMIHDPTACFIREECESDRLMQEHRHSFSSHVHIEAKVSILMTPNGYGTAFPVNLSTAAVHPFSVFRADASK